MCDYNYDATDTILLERLLEYYPDTFTTGFQWPGMEENSVILLYDVLAEADTIAEQSEPLHHFEDQNREWHMGRILYFINHPEKIRPIVIDLKCYKGHVTSEPFIEDGWHRFAALCCLGNTHVEAAYSGRRDVLAYLKGESDERPFGW